MRPSVKEEHVKKGVQVGKGKPCLKRLGCLSGSTIYYSMSLGNELLWAADPHQQSEDNNKISLYIKGSNKCEVPNPVIEKEKSLI